MSDKHAYKIHSTPEFNDSTLIVAWNEDVGRLGPAVLDYLNRMLDSYEFAEIEPEYFFPLGGVAVEDDVAQFPESKFYYCSKKQIVLFRSNPPRYEWYKFLDSILELAQNHCHVKEIFIIGGMIYLGPHTTPRQLLGVSNSRETRVSLEQYDITCDLDYETPPGQRPTLSSYLTWAAKTRDISAVSLWVPIPFYLVEVEDPKAWQKVAEFLNTRLDLELDLSELYEKSAKLNEKMALLRDRSQEINDYITKLESNIPLSQEETEKLAHEVYQHLGNIN